MVSFPQNMRTTAIILGIIVFVLDLTTKWWVRNTDGLGYYPVIEGVFAIHYVQNKGIAFGLFHTLQSEWKPVILSMMAAIASVVVLYYIRTTHPEQKLSLLALGLLLGGILGNFVDRLLNQYVVDFLELHWKNHFVWPTFNLADAAITGGVLIILYQTFAKESPRK